EWNVHLLAAQAGIPPTAVEVLRRYSHDAAGHSIGDFFREWNRWVAAVLETHVSHPLLAYYRSQRPGLTWLAALTVVLDLCALTLSGVGGAPIQPAHHAFEMGHYAVVELCRLFSLQTRADGPPRLPPADRTRLHGVLAAAGVQLSTAAETQQR